MKKLALILILVLILVFLFSLPVRSELVEKFDFNPDYESLDFAVDGSIDFRVFLFPAGLDFYGRGEDSDGATPAISIEDASYRLFSLSFGGDSAKNLGEQIIGEAVGVAASPEEILEVYETDEESGFLYFLYEPLSEATDRRMVELIENREISDLAVDKGHNSGRIYGGRIDFEAGLVKKLLALSNDWWADLDVDWKKMGNYSFPESVRGEGYYETDLNLEVDFYDYEIN